MSEIRIEVNMIKIVIKTDACTKHEKRNYQMPQPETKAPRLDLHIRAGNDGTKLIYIMQGEPLALRTDQLAAENQVMCRALQ